MNRLKPWFEQINTYTLVGDQPKINLEIKWWHKLTRWPIEVCRWNGASDEVHCWIKSGFNAILKLAVFFLALGIGLNIRAYIPSLLSCKHIHRQHNKTDVSTQQHVCSAASLSHLLSALSLTFFPFTPPFLSIYLTNTQNLCTYWPLRQSFNVSTQYFITSVLS